MYKRTKIVCTMGPACDSDETIREMIKAGMNVARFNFSHGSYDEHHGRIERVRRISKELGMPVGILLDTKGPEVRTGLLVDGKKVAVKTGDKIVVTAQPTSEDFHGTSEHISLDYLALPSEVEKGSLILIDDGLVALEVESVDGQDMTCVVKNDGLIGERKGVNMPNVNMIQIIQTHIKNEKSTYARMREMSRDLAASSYRAAKGSLEAAEYLGLASRMLTRGQLKVNTQIMSSDKALRQLGGIIDRMSMAIVIAGLFIGSSVVYYARIEPVVFGIPVIGFMGYVSALVLALMLGRNIWLNSHGGKR